MTTRSDDMSAGASIAEPPPRFGHFSAPVEGHLCVSGGRTKGSTKEKGELVHTFNQLSESWSSKQCQGPSPPDGLNSGASAYAGHHLYLYGGYDGSHCQNSLHQLDTRSWTWSHLSSAGPMRTIGSQASSHKHQSHGSQASVLHHNTDHGGGLLGGSPQLGSIQQ